MSGAGALREGETAIDGTDIAIETQWIVTER